jgi:hypothetical protein
MASFTMRSIEIWLHHDNFNRNTRFLPSHSWYPAMNIIKQMTALENHGKERPMTSI